MESYSLHGLYWRTPAEQGEPARHLLCLLGGSTSCSVLAMTLSQVLSFAIIAGMFGLFLWNRLRYDVVALLALLAAVTVGIVPADHAFRGFSNPVVVIVAAALVVSRAVAESGVIEAMIMPLVHRKASTDAQIGVLVLLVTVLSALMKNVGALAIFMPVAVQLAERRGTPASKILMPLSFGSLVGGLITLIGTSPNVLISVIREEITGTPFHMFDFTPVGLGTAAAAILFLTFGWRLIPRDRKGRRAVEALFRIDSYFSEIRIPPGASLVGRKVGDLEAMADGGLSVVAIIREGARRYVPAAHWTLHEEDILAVQCDPHLLKRVIDKGGLALVGSGETAASSGVLEEFAVVEAVVTATSRMLGRTPAELRLRDRFGVDLLAFSRQGERGAARLKRTRFQVGDVLVLQGGTEAMPDALAALGCLPLAGRNLRFGPSRRSWLPLAILGMAMVLAATQAVRVEVAFFAAVVVIVALKVLSLREVYDSLEGPIIVMLGCMIPVGEAVRETGGSALIAGWLAQLATALPPLGMLVLMMVASMLVTPVLHHAAAVLVMGPIAASLAGKLGLRMDPFLMAVAVGASCDFLTPIGHQCNALVMGPGGYRFGDYWRLGLPLSIIVVAVATSLIAWFWPLMP